MHLKIMKPLADGSKAQLHGVQLNKDLQDELSYF
jgi:hypothetical protein